MGLKVGSLESKHVAVMRRVVMQIIYTTSSSISIISISIWTKEKKRSGGAHGWVLGSRNSCEHMHMCFLPFVLCHVGPFFIYMPSSLTLPLLNGSCIFYFSSQIYWLYNILFTFSFTSRYSFIHIYPTILCYYLRVCFSLPHLNWILLAKDPCKFTYLQPNHNRYLPSFSKMHMCLACVMDDLKYLICASKTDA